MKTSHFTLNEVHLPWLSRGTLLLACISITLVVGTILLQPIMRSSVAASPKVAFPHPLVQPPFSVQEVQKYFGRKIGTVPSHFGSMTIFPQPARRDDIQDYEVAVTAVSTDEILIEFRGTGPAALDIAKEFVGSSFFRPDESAELASMLQQMHEEPVRHFQRFDAKVVLQERLDLLRLIFHFNSPAFPEAAP